MITVSRNEEQIRIDHVVNREDFYGEDNRYVLIIEGITLLIAARHDQDALDIYADSEWGRLTRLDDDVSAQIDTGEESEEDYTRLGNAGDWHDLTNVYYKDLFEVDKSKINFFCARGEDETI